MNYYEQSLLRKKEIETGLLELMQEMPYSEITVKDIADHLHFVRKTFYYYFPNKRACLESLTDRLIQECNLRVVQSLPDEATSGEIYAVRLDFWIEHRDFLDCILRNGLGSFLVERFLAYVRQEDPAVQVRLGTEAVGCDGDVLFFYMIGQIFLLLKWCAEGFVLPMEEMIQKHLRLVHEPLLPPEK